MMELQFDIFESGFAQFSLGRMCDRQRTATAWSRVEPMEYGEGVALLVCS